MQQKQKNFQQLLNQLQIIDKIELKTNQKPVSVVILGLSKSYKTTLCYSLLKQKLIPTKKFGKIIYEPHKIIGNAKIQSSNKIGTSVLNFFQNQNYNIYDPAGFNEKDNLTRRLRTKYLYHQLFNNKKKRFFKFIICIPQQHFTGVANLVKLTVRYYYKLFKFKDGLNQDELIDSSMLVITKSESRSYEAVETTMRLIMETVDIEDNDERIFFIKLFKRLESKNRIVLHKISESNNQWFKILEEISKIQVKYNKDIGNRSNQKEENQQAEFILAIQQILIEFIKIVIQDIYMLSQHILDIKTYQINIQKYEQYIQKYFQNYPLTSYPQRKHLSKTYYTNLYTLIKLFRSQPGQKKLSLKQTWENFKIILNQIYIYHFNNQHHANKFLNIIQFIQNILYKVQILIQATHNKVLRQFYDICISVFDEGINDKISKFAINVKILPQKDIEYFQSLLQLFKQQNQSVQKTKKIYLIYKYLAKIYLNKNQFLKALTYFIKSLSNFQSNRKIKNQNQQSQFEQQLFTNIINLLIIYGKYQLALDLCLISDDTQKILFIFEKLIFKQKQKQKKMNLLLQKAQYQLKITQFQSAILTFKQAKDLASGQLKQQIRKSLKNMNDQKISILKKNFLNQSYLAEARNKNIDIKGLQKIVSEIKVDSKEDEIFYV